MSRPKNYLTPEQGRVAVVEATDDMYRLAYQLREAVDDPPAGVLFTDDDPNNSSGLLHLLDEAMVELRLAVRAYLDVIQGT